MTEAEWTAAVTQEGWYWWRESPGEKHKMVRVTKGYKALRVEVPLHNSWMFGAVDGFGGEFKGPLSPDSFQQGRVEGLRDAEVIAQFMVMATPSNVAAALRFMADKLEAQQAQEAKGVGDVHG